MASSNNLLDQAQEPNPLDPSEATLATIGLTTILSGDMPYVGVMKQREIMALPRRIDKLGEDLVFDRLPRKLKMPRPFTWQQLFDRFIKPIPESTIEAIGRQFPHNIQDQAIAFLAYLARVYKHVADMLPVQQYQTLLGQVPIEPTGDKMWQFYNRYWLVTDPLIALTLAQSGALLPEQVAILSEFYPSLLEHMKSAVLAGLIRRKSQDKGFIDLVPRAEMGCAALLQQRQVEFQSNLHKVPPPTVPGAVPPTKPNPALVSPAQQAAQP